MIELALSARDRRTLVIGVSTVATLMGLGKGLPAAMQWNTNQLAEASSLAQQVAARRSRARSLSALRDTLDARRERLDWFDSVLVAGASPSAAAANLASLLGDLAEEAPIKVTALQLRADTATMGSLVRVGVRVTGVTDVIGLAGFLRAVETADAPISIAEISVSQSDPAAPPTRAEALRVDLLVEGIARIRHTEAR